MKKTNLILYPALVIFFVAGAVSASQQNAISNFLLDRGELSFVAKHKMHDTHSTSKQLKGKGVCQDQDCEFLIAVPVKSFDSANSNRDEHMQMITRAAQFPIISVRIKTKLPNEKAKIDPTTLHPEVEFAGEKASIAIDTLSSQKTASGFQIVFKGHFALSDFKVEAPSLLGIAVENNIEIESTLDFKQ